MGIFIHKKSRATNALKSIAENLEVGNPGPSTNPLAPQLSPLHPYPITSTNRHTSSPTYLQSAKPAKSQKAIVFLGSLLNEVVAATSPPHPVWTVEVLGPLRGSTPKFWTIGKLRALFLSPRGNIWVTTNRPSGTPARNRVSAMRISRI